MRAHVQTRGRRRQDDYTFFARLLDDRWWEGYGAYADFDYPLLLVEADATTWRAYLGCLATSREDITGTPIQLTLALDGDCGQDRETDWVAALVEEHVRARAGTEDEDDTGTTAGRSGALGVLDQVFDEPAVAALFAGTPAPGAAVADLVDTAVRRHAESGASPPGAARPSPGPASVPAGSWVSGIGGAGARDAFAVHAGALLTGKAVGRALLLNSLDGPDALPPLAPDEHLVVLADAPEERFGTTPVAIGGKASGRSPAARGDSRPVWAALAACAAAVAVLLRRALRRHRRAPDEA